MWIRTFNNRGGEGMKWIVVYFFIQLSMIPCLQPPPTADEFGRIYASNHMTLEACWREDRTTLRKTFDTEVEAKAFVDRANHERDLTGFEIREVKVDD